MSPLGWVLCDRQAVAAVIRFHRGGVGALSPKNGDTPSHGAGGRVRRRSETRGPGAAAGPVISQQGETGREQSGAGGLRTSTLQGGAAPMSCLAATAVFTTGGAGRRTLPNWVKGA
jgi:hypothetical protein